MAILIFSRFSLLSTCRTTSKWVEHNWHGIRNTFTMFATCITEHWHNHEKVEMKNSVQTHNETKEPVVFLLYLKFKNVRNISFNMFFFVLLPQVRRELFNNKVSFGSNHIKTKPCFHCLNPENLLVAFTFEFVPNEGVTHYFHVVWFWALSHKIQSIIVSYSRV